MYQHLKLPLPSTWTTASRKKILFKDLGNDHLVNIINMIDKDGFTNMTYNHNHYFAALLEMDRRITKCEKSGGLFLDINDFFKDKHKRIVANLKYIIKNKGESKMHNKMEKNVLKELQLKLFGNKVEIIDSQYQGKYGIVVAVYDNLYRTSSAQVRVKTSEHASGILLNVNQVRLVEEIRLYAYQDKKGTIEWTSKEKSSLVLKRSGQKRFEAADKMIEV